MQWGPKGRHAHSKAMKSAWTQNVMCTVWFDARGVRLVDYLPQGQTINAEHIMDQLHRLHTAVLYKRRIMRQKPFIIWTTRVRMLPLAVVPRWKSLAFGS